MPARRGTGENFHTNSTERSRCLTTFVSIHMARWRFYLTKLSSNNEAQYFTWTSVHFTSPSLYGRAERVAVFPAKSRSRVGTRARAHVLATTTRDRTRGPLAPLGIVAVHCGEICGGSSLGVSSVIS